MGGKRSDKHTTTLREVKGYFEQAGFQLVKDCAQWRFIHTLHLALFQRVGGRP